MYHSNFNGKTSHHDPLEKHRGTGGHNPAEKHRGTGGHDGKENEGKSSII
jgi:hypothetical protein